MGAGLIELLTVNPTPAVGDPSFDEAQDAVGLVDGAFTGGGGRTGATILGAPPRAIEGQFGRQLFVVEGAAWKQVYCWRGAQSELVSVPAEKERDFSLLNSQSNISNGKY